MSDTSSIARGGEFATARRGGLDTYEVRFIGEKRERRVADAQIAKMLGRSLSMVRSLDLVALEPPVTEVRIPRQSALGEVGAAVAERHGLSIKDLIGPSLKRPITLARQEAFWCCYQLRAASGARRFSQPQIGRFFGNRDHTTVLFGIQQHEWRMLSDPLLSEFANRLGFAA